MLNNGGPRYKRSALERHMNQDVIWCVLVLIFLCVIGAIGCKLWLQAYPTLKEPFKLEGTSDSAEAFLAFWTYIIILQVTKILLFVLQQFVTYGSLQTVNITINITKFYKVNAVFI